MLRLSSFDVAVISVVALNGAVRFGAVRPTAGGSLCTMRPGGTIAIVRVEQDTMLPNAPVRIERMSSSHIPTNDSLLATPETPMPAARVRLLQLDSATRLTLASHGITESAPTAYLRAAPYRHDCQTIRWTDSVPFVVNGEVGYVRGMLASREQWIGSVPLIVIPNAWYYPYPRRRSLVLGEPPDFKVPADMPLAPAEAVFSFNALVLPTGVDDHSIHMNLDSAMRAQVIAWARANPEAASLQPLRRRLRELVLLPDSRELRRRSSRLRGTYRVDLVAGDDLATWYFRTHARPDYKWDGADSARTTAELIEAPYVGGYTLAGYAAPTPDSLLVRAPGYPARPPMVWLATTDRPTAPGNDARHVLPGQLDLQLGAAPRSIWRALEPFVRPMGARESEAAARLYGAGAAAMRHARIPITLRIDSRGTGVQGDTTLAAGTQRLRVRVERVDTVTVSRSAPR